MLIHFTGKVVRVERRGKGSLEKFGIAALTESYEMVCNGQSSMFSVSIISMGGSRSLIGDPLQAASEEASKTS